MDEAKIKEVLGDVLGSDNALRFRFLSHEVHFVPGDALVLLGGRFSPEQLEAIAAHMRAHGSK